MTPSKLILTLVVLLLAALAIARQAQQFREERAFESSLPSRQSGGWMGVQLAELNPEIVREYRLDTSDGVLIVEVVSDSPAERAGLLSGDVIRRMDDNAISSWNDLRRVLRSTTPGQAMNFTVIRDKQERRIALTLGQRPAPPPPPQPELPY